jgi:hypothetical protein
LRSRSPGAGRVGELFGIRSMSAAFLMEYAGCRSLELALIVRDAGCRGRTRSHSSPACTTFYWACVLRCRRMAVWHVVRQREHRGRDPSAGAREIKPYPANSGEEVRSLLMEDKEAEYRPRNTWMCYPKQSSGHEGVRRGAPFIAAASPSIWDI